MKRAAEQRAQSVEQPIAIVAAGGDGERLGADGPKALVLCAGRPLIAWCLDAIASSATFARGAGTVVVAAHRAALDRFEEIAASFREQGLAVLVAEGGVSRSHSVASALRTGLSGKTAGDGLVLVHDAARPLLTAEMIDSMVSEIDERPSAVDCLVAAEPVTDTIKLVDDQLRVVESPPRDRLWAAQTPQLFRARALATALGIGRGVPDQVLAEATDDASLVERAGGSVAVYRPRAVNLKVTTVDDLARADRHLQSDA